METRLADLRMNSASAKKTPIPLNASRTTLILTRCTAEGRFVFVNRAGADFLGRPTEDIIGRSITDVLGRDAMAAIEPYIELVLRGEDVEFGMEIPYSNIGRRFMHAI